MKNTCVVVLAFTLTAWSTPVTSALPVAQDSATESGTRSAQGEGAEAGEVEDMLAQRLNDERAAKGVPRLTRSAELDAVAAARSEDMAARDYFGHTTPEGKDIFDVMRKDGMRWTRASETLHRNSAGMDDLEEAVRKAFDGFMNSSEHRRILTDCRYEEFGVGHTYGDDDRHYFTVIVMRH